MEGTNEQEELLVYMDFNTKIEDVFFSIDKEFKIISLDSQEPVLQLGNQVFQGEWRDTLGTYLFFEESEETKYNTDPLFSENIDTTMRYCFKTDKLLHMSRIFLRPNIRNETDSTVNENMLQQTDLPSAEN